MILLVGYYHEVVHQRREELAECLRRNAANPHIEAVHVFIEDVSDPAEVITAVADEDRATLRFVELRRRLLFDDMFRHAGEQLSGHVVAIANADICFDDTLRLLAGRDLFNRLLCLSRWDEHADGTLVFYDEPWSQDAWIFEAPVRPFDAAFHLGLPGCDNRIAGGAVAAGIAVSNPSRSIVAHHLHNSGRRSYSARDRIRGVVREVPAGTLAPADDVIFALTTGRRAEPRPSSSSTRPPA